VAAMSGHIAYLSKNVRHTGMLQPRRTVQRHTY
jgi:hypothetical protein